MRSPPLRAGLSIFARSFLLVLAALVLALGVAIALLAYAPIRSDSTELVRVVGLLSSPSLPSNDALHVYPSDTPPGVPANLGFERDTRVQAWIARWLGLDESAVVFASTQKVRLRKPPPGNGSKEPPPFDAGPPPYRAGDGGPGPPPPRDDPSRSGSELAPDTLLHDEFIVAARQADGRWRVVESTSRSRIDRVGKQVALLFLLGMLLLLPLAWWFSRALSAPIRDFANAADHLGRNPLAPGLPLTGPREIVVAAESFNTMQTRLNRMVAERTQMVGAIAHDLRTPLARLAFRLQRLPAGEQEKAQADIEEMKSMISAALDFLRDRSSVGKREPLDLRSLVENVVNGLADTGHDVALEPGESATINGDRIALRRVVANLVDNALKYGTHAQVRLRVQDGECVLEVDDNGPGIDQAQAEKLFMPFYRGEASRNRETGGIGLGLSAARDIVIEHGGRVELSNRKEGGLRASAIVPLRSDA